MDPQAGVQQEEKQGESEGTRKKFSVDLHNAYDWDGKMAVSRYFGLAHPGAKTLWDPEGPYGIDLAIIMPEGEKIWIEVEVRPDAWNESVWKFDTVHFLERKVKYLKHTPGYLFALDRSMSHAMVVPFTVVRDHKKISVPNKYAKGELFYDIPVSECAYRWLIRGPKP